MEKTCAISPPDDNSVQQMSSEEGITVLMTTHDVGLMGAADMIIELENGERINA